MSTMNLMVALAGLSIAAYFIARARSISVAGGPERIKYLHSLPSYHGFYCSLWCALPALVLLIVWSLAQPGIIFNLVAGDLPEKYQSLGQDQLTLVVSDAINHSTGAIAGTDETDPGVIAAGQHYLALEKFAKRLRTVAIFLLFLLGFVLTLVRIKPDFRARSRVESIVKAILIACSSIAILTTIGIFLSVIFESIRFFNIVPVSEFLFGTHWSPQTAIRTDQVGSSGSFGAIPLFTGTLLIAVIAMLVAAPLGLMTAIYLSEYARPKFRSFAKPALEVLAGIPTVVYGFFAITTMGPLIAGIGGWIGMDINQGAALGVGIVMGVMIIPFVSSLSDDVIMSVPSAMRDGSYGLGATRSETIRRVIIPAALPGIIGGMLLAISRAIGETMIVVMAAGLTANLTANPLEPVTTVTVQIVNLLVGDQEFDSAKTLAAFALGLVLFIVTLVLNVIALGVVRRYREEYV